MDYTCSKLSMYLVYEYSGKVVDEKIDEKRDESRLKYYAVFILTFSAILIPTCILPHICNFTFPVYCLHLGAWAWMAPSSILEPAFVACSLSMRLATNLELEIFSWAYNDEAYRPLSLLTGKAYHELTQHLRNRVWQIHVFVGRPTSVVSDFVVEFGA